jgi:oxalate decarboxylase
LPTFKFELERSPGKVIGGSSGKEATVIQSPISKAQAGVSMRIKPGAMRELHWHATAAEWGFVTEGTVRTTGVVLEMDPGALRELHCHPNASEWQYALS